MNTPKVSVLMPVYNGERFVAESIRSVLTQTYRDFELIIVNDGSTDNTPSIIRSFRDERIRLVQHSQNQGLFEALNEGVRLARGTYIARLDSDDIAYRKRLQKQIAFLDSHPDFALVGSAVRLIDSYGHPTGVKWKNTTPPEKIPVLLLFHNAFSHSAVMMRVAALPKPAYGPHRPPVEDYGLWVRLAEKSKVWNLPNVLLDYRVHTDSITSDMAAQKETAVEEVVREQLSRFDIAPTSAEYKVHRTSYGYKGEDIWKFLDAREAWLIRLMKANREKKVYREEIFASALADRWLESCRANARFGLSIWKRCFRSPLAQYLSWNENRLPILKFALKALVRR